MLSIKHLLDILENAKNVEALLVRSKNINVVVCSPIIDYSGHLDSLEDPSLCEFILTYKKLLPSKNSNLKRFTFNKVPTLSRPNLLNALSTFLDASYQIYHKKI
jgi:hypothetical protein